MGGILSYSLFKIFSTSPKEGVIMNNKTQINANYRRNNFISR